MKIKIVTSKAWGNKRYYPACKTSHILLRLAHRKSFNAEDLGVIKELGYDIEDVTPREEL